MHRIRWVAAPLHGIILHMHLQTHHPYTLTVEPSPSQAQRFRWEIRQVLRVVDSSKDVWPTQRRAAQAGHAALCDLIAEWRAQH